MSLIKGTINYMAPEALQNRSKVKGKTVVKYNCKADIWSLGCILYNLVYGQTPYHDFDNLFQKANAILDPNHQINYPPIDDLLLLDVMQVCIAQPSPMYCKLWHWLCIYGSPFKPKSRHVSHKYSIIELFFAYCRQLF